ncbi:MAG: Nif3-like dinuclear metal center hexameric protein [Chloroflexi bacterium]|nr:Nif3-like dinuclear metal center hexameric protein [Chloroflexota bacterium]MCL5273436.1 Nif3-like dinuclear metal center hexameric protein [Chloroflexota bacterium]
MTNARQIADIFETIAPIPSGIAGDELGFIHGNPEQEVRGIGCMWIATTQSITAAAQAGLNTIICHEGLWMPPQQSPWYDGPAAGEIHSNRVRKELLERYGMVVYRSHSNWDALRGDGVPDQAVAALGIDGLRETARQKFFSVQELPDPRSVEWLVERMRAGLGFSDCRVFGERARKVRRFAFLIGGFGENQFHMPQAARDLGAEAILIGEMSEFIVIACLEMGLPVVESLHSMSETPAIRRQAQLLAARLPDLPVRFIPSGAAAM